MAAVDYIQGKMNTYHGIAQKVLWCESKAQEYTDRAETLKGEAQEVLDLVKELESLQEQERAYLDEADRLKGNLSGASNVDSILEKIDEAKENAAKTAARIRSLYYAR